MSDAQTVYDVPSISCGHCKQAIEGGLATVEGVSAVSVDVDGRSVLVEGDVSADTIRTTLDELGYPVAATRPA
jgi:copper chaperone